MILDRPTGLVRIGKHLGYGVEHGCLMGWPDWAQRLIVRVWNRVSCRVFGHHIVFGDVCTACCRKVEGG